MYQSENAQFAWAKAHFVFFFILFYFFLHSKAFKNVVGKGPARCSCVKSTWTTALVFHMNELQTMLPATLLRVVHRGWTMFQADRGAGV